MNQLTVSGYLTFLGICFHTLQFAGENIYIGDANFKSRRISSGHLTQLKCGFGTDYTHQGFRIFDQDLAGIRAFRIVYLTVSHWETLPSQSGLWTMAARNLVLQIGRPLFCLLRLKLLSLEPSPGDERWQHKRSLTCFLSSFSFLSLLFVPLFGASRPAPAWLHSVTDN